MLYCPLKAGPTTLISGVGYNERGQLALLQRPYAPSTTLSYLGASGNFRLDKILHGSEGGALPGFLYGAQNYDKVGNLLGMQMKINTGTASTETYSFSYDEMNRLTLAALDGPGATDYLYAYEYDRLGNITGRTGTDPDMVYSYGSSGTTPAVTGGPQAVTRVDNSTGTDWSYDYDERGNLDGKYQGTTLTHDYTFDVENRLASVRTGNQTMSFAYDADGQRVLTTRHDGTIIYTPFPDYEVEDPLTGSNTIRTTYRLAGQIVAVQTKVGTAAGIFYYTYTDHLGNVVLLSYTGGTPFYSSLARYDSFGNYRTTPATTTNPAITSHGFTGHRHNNTGLYPTQNVGLIYMNARYYLPEVGRFISPDSIVPEPGNPQSFNRYSYGYNNPVKYVDPSGHCAGSPDGIGNSQDENLCWASVATIRNLWNHTDYWQQRWGSYDDFFANVGSHPLLGRDFFVDELMRYMQSDQYKSWSEQIAISQSASPPPIDTGEYWVLSITTPFPMPLFVGFKVIRDDWGVWYFNVHEASMPGGGIMRGQIYVNDTTKPTDAIPLADFPIELQPDLTQSILPGISGGGSAGWFFVGGGVNVASGPNAHLFVEGGLYRPGIAGEIGYTFIAPWLR